MGILKSFLKENKKLVFAVFIVWVSFCLGGTVFGSKLGGSDFADAREYVEASFLVAPRVKDILVRGALSHIKFLGLITISSLGAFMSPIAFFTAGYKGFSSGFCASVIMRVFSFKGIAINFASIIAPLTLSLPIYLAIFVSALKFALSPRKNILSVSVSQRRKQWLSYLFLQLCLTLCLFLVTVMEAFLNYGIIFMIAAGNSN